MDELSAGMFRGLAAGLNDLARGRLHLATMLARVGTVCRRLLPVDGVAVSVMWGTDDRRVLYTSDAVIKRVEALQFSLGEGPCYETLTARRPVLLPDLARSSTATWPVFAAEMVAEPVSALFVFPLGEGAARIGALGMYRRAAGRLTSGEIAVGRRLADVAAVSLLAAVSTAEHDLAAALAWLETADAGQSFVHQATGMVMVAFRTSARQSLSLLRGHAFATGRLVEEVAADLVTGRMRPKDLIR